MKIKCIVSFVLLALILMINTSQSYAWLIYHKPEFRGKVMDAETKEPIEGAVVVVAYSRRSAGIAGDDVSVIKSKRDSY